MLSDAEKEEVRSCVESEGFDYCFRSYTAFEAIVDEEFHAARVAYVEAADKLEALYSEEF